MTPETRLFSPFRGIRYTIPESRDLSSVIAPPYDVISEAMQSDLRERHEHNFVRIELPRGEAGERPDGRYQRAAETLRAWLASGVLVREVERSVYVLEQEFTAAGRTWRRRGAFGLVRLPERRDTSILSHEGTLPDPKADRLRLLRACEAMTSPIMLMLEDERGELLDRLQELQRAPDALARDADGTIHRLWVLSGHDVGEAVCSAIGGGPLFIADGHHRFETALAYRDEMREKHPDAPAEAGFNYALSLVASAKEAGLRIFPTHRLVAGLDDEARERARSCIAGYFERRPGAAALGSGDPDWNECGEPARYVFGVYWGGGEYELLAARDEELPPMNSVVDRLEVSVLHQLLIDPMLAGAICPADDDGRVSHDSETTAPRARGARVSYVTDDAQAMAAVDRGDYDVAFFLRATCIADVLAAARARQRMPGKSTYFYPKVPAGLVLSDASAEPI